MLPAMKGRQAVAGGRLRDGVEEQVEAFLAAWFATRQIVQGLNFNRAHQHGLGATQFLVLTLLEEASPDAPATIGGLARRLKLDPAPVVRTVDSLEGRGLFTRARDPRDRRRVFVELTEAGRAAQRSSRQQFTAAIVAIFRAMSPAGRAALVTGLGEFVAIGPPDVPAMPK